MSRARDRGRARGNDPQLKTRRRRALRVEVARERGPCAYCGGPIAYHLPWPHPLSFVLDEIVPRALGGSAEDRANVRPAHLRCNSAAGARLGNKIKSHSVSVQRPSFTSRDW